jgi:3-hydroxyacyl-[acyl-carrier-protein] dehydratase
MRFFLVDRVTEIVPGKSASGIKCWSLDNEIFQDHFPGLPSTPGVLLTESMAQLSGVLIKESFYDLYGRENPVYPILSIIQKAKFRSFVKPGDQCILNSELIALDRSRANVNVKTFVNDELVCDATLSFLIGLQSDMGNNPYIEKMNEYFHNLMPLKK